MPDKQTKLTLITTHINADFDAVASMLAAQKLYPGSVVVFPGSQEKNLRDFFINSMAYLYNMADIKNVDFSNVKRLVLVDTKQPGRIGRLAQLIDTPGIEIHIYDHHPDTENDIKGDYEVSRQTGATVTILTKIIRDKGIEISSEEATIMCLGLYEDTGSFTFSSTCEEDFNAAGFLLSKGADLNTVSNLLVREIEPKQIELLNDMIQGASRYNINGIEIIVTTVSSDQYIQDFAFLVHKMIKIEDVDAIFALARMQNKIYVVARSRVSEVNSGVILSSLGGGGHLYAASASIRNLTLTQAEHKLVDIIFSKVRSEYKAKAIMSSPSIMIESHVSCQEASLFLTRYNINALLVTIQNNGKTEIVGFITRQIIEKALYHKLNNVPVSEYMSSEITSVKSDADITEIQEKIIDSKQRILPVIDNGIIKGVITRTDLLNVLARHTKKNIRNASDNLQQPVKPRTRNIVKFMNQRISDDLINILKSIGKVADEIGLNAYVIGGFVRDLFMYRPNEDMDIVIEGDGIAFSKKFAQNIKETRLHLHEKFGTAVIIFPHGFKIDIASARTEYYNYPAALPTIEISSLKLDLFRRDFTINTLAIQLNSEKFGTLVDFFSAQKDIKEKVIRVLHNLSFVEDPTRIFRAIRFEQRFGFSIGKLTLQLIRNAVNMDFLTKLSGHRVFTELRQILEEENPLPAILRLNDFNLLSIIDPTITLNKESVPLFNSVKEVLNWYDLMFLEESYIKWAVYFMILLRRCDKKRSQQICNRFKLTPKLERLLSIERFNAEKSLYSIEKTKDITNSIIYNKLSVFKIESVLYIMAITRHKKVKRYISDFCTKLRYVKTFVTGKDLIQIGLKPGPIYNKTLSALLDAKLNGLVNTKTEELAFVKD